MTPLIGTVRPVGLLARPRWGYYRTLPQAPGSLRREMTGMAAVPIRGPRE